MTEESNTPENGPTEGSAELNLDDHDKPLHKEFQKPNLEGQITTITGTRAVLYDEVKETQNKDRKFKNVGLKVFYNIKELQNWPKDVDVPEELFENYAGIRQYLTKDGKLEDPTLHTEGETAVANLLRKYAEMVDKDPQEISLKEFAEGLHGKRVKLEHTKGTAFGKKYSKNVISEFINPEESE